MSITTILDKFCAERQQHDTDARDNSKFRVSDAGKCRLMRYWKRQGKPMVPHYTPEILRTMHVGILLHNWIQDVVKQAGIALEIELELEDDHRIGHLDALVRLDGKRVLYDFKTVSGKKWFYLEKRNFDPDLQHVAQIITYGQMLNSLPDKLSILYLNRDTLNLAECLVDAICYENLVVDDWETLISAWERQVEPESNPESWECAYCGYRSTCTHKL